MKKYDIYRNLKGNYWSIRCPKTKRVVGHSSRVILCSDVEFIVEQKGRERALRERVRNVHAYARGVIAHDTKQYVDPFKDRKIEYGPYLSELYDKTHIGDYLPDTQQGQWTIGVTYNPFKYTSFVDSAGNSIYNADYADFDMYPGHASVIAFTADNKAEQEWQQ